MTGYAITAQFYDAMAGDQRGEVNARIASALEGLDTRPGPVVDIGAGTGLTTKVIATALPDADIFAVEPESAMRAALMTRVWSDPDLRRRVSILPMSIFAASLPQVIAGAVASASLVHFSPEDRRRLWKLLALRLAPGGRAVIEIQCPEAEDIEETRMASARVGQIDYEGRVSAERVDDQRQLWHISYLAMLGDEEIDRQTADYICWAVSTDLLAIEARENGLMPTVTEDLIILEKVV